MRQHAQTHQNTQMLKPVKILIYVKKHQNAQTHQTRQNAQMHQNTQTIPVSILRISRKIEN